MIENYFEVAIKSNDFEKSIDFYNKLGYKKVNQNLVSDGQVTIRLMDNKDLVDSQSIMFYTKYINNVIDILNNQNIDYDSQKENSRSYIKFTFDKNKFLVSDKNYDNNHIKDNKSYLGKFGEYTLPTTDLDKSIGFFDSIGFNTGLKKKDPYPWSIQLRGNIILGLHQNIEITNPAITYFSEEMPDIAKQIKHDGVTLLFEEKHDNQIINSGVKSPENLHFYLFKGSV